MVYIICRKPELLKEDYYVTLKGTTKIIVHSYYWPSSWLHFGLSVPESHESKPGP